MKDGADMENLASYIDFAVLNPELTPSDIVKEARRAVELKCATVCVNPAYLELLEPIVKGTATGLCPVTDFPFGASSTSSRVAQIREAARFEPVKEIDIVCQYGKLREGRKDEVEADLKACVQAAHECGKELKVILETDALDDKQIAEGCECAIAAGADFVKTSTGFYASPDAVGADPKKVAVMLEAVKGRCKVKASGKIRTRERALELVKMGVNRLGIGSKSVPGILAKSLLALLLLGAGKGDDIQYFDALSQMGGSVLSPLVRKINTMPDKKLSATGPVARAKILENISGNVGGIRVQQSGGYGNLNTPGYTYVTVDFGKELTSIGSKVSTMSGPVAAKKARRDSCRLALPPGFMEGFNSMRTLAGRKHGGACSETGACIFLGITSGQLRGNLNKGTEMFRQAYEQGNLEGGAMYAISLYYGIGLKSADKEKAYSVIAEMVEALGTEQYKGNKARELFRSGWLARRIEEAVSLGIIEKKP